MVNRDLMATLPGRDALILMADDRGQVYVAMPDGRWHGNSVTVDDPDDLEGLAEFDDAATVLTAVADAAQSTIMELLWQAWPVCWVHRIGMHPRPAGTASDSYPGETEATGPPVWWCRGSRDGNGHDVSLVGELADTLPGKQRRALRRDERRRERDGRR
ncbi:hypothetical protein [Streptomyces sp. NPDC058614]|uniref:hypothetical protein n=1 Tax=Streptomyces sp. NPDC058614 TaxID=3346557 RepID=UPI003659E6D2